MTTRPFRFGVVLATPPDAASIAGVAGRIEELGYDTLLSPDPLGELDPLPVLAAAAAATSTLRVGTFVLAEPFRERAALEWQVRSLHRFTGGRFELGLGTGHPRAGAQAAKLGRRFGSAAERVGELEAATDTLRAEKDRPPLLVAGAGPRMLRLAARAADTVALAWPPTTTEPAAKSIVDKLAAEAGTRMPEIELCASLMAVGDEPAPWLERYLGTSTTQLAADGAVSVLPGTPEQGVRTLLGWRERLGISYFTVNSAFAEQFAPILAALRGR